MIREVIGGLLDDVDDRDEFDVVDDFSGPFPVEIISRMLGVPEGERQQIRHWLDLSRCSASRARWTRRPRARPPCSSSASTSTSSPRRSGPNPADDMLSRLTQVTVDRGDGEQTGLRRPSRSPASPSLIGGAGAETVTKLVGNAVVLFARQPRPVAARSSTIGRRSPAAVEETLRYPAALAVPGPVLGRGPHVRGRHHPRRLPGPAAHRRRHPRPPPVRRPRRRSTSIARRPSRSASATASTAASARRSPAWRAASPSRSSPLAGSAWRSTTSGLRRVNMSNVAGYASVPVRAVRRG